MNAKNPDTFINDIIDVYKKHGMCLSHEDGHGAFIVTDLCDEYVEWLLQFRAEFPEGENDAS